MAKVKSFLQPMCVDRVGHAHNCQHNSAHRLQKGEVRLALKVDRTTEHFCAQCAIESLTRDVEKMRRMIAELQAG